MEKHTPGPWMIVNNGTIASKALPGKILATVNSYDRPNFEADTRLIAAAPEMYSLLKKIIEFELLFKNESKEIIELLNKIDNK